MSGIKWAIESSGFKARFRPIDLFATRAIDIGGADVNGSARQLVDSTVAWVNWMGWDIEDGPGVDLVIDCRKPPPAEYLGRADIVLCTEVFEHVQDWTSILCTIVDLLTPGGFAFITCASDGRRPHGARGALNPAPGEWYRNVSQEDLYRAIDQYPVERRNVKYNPNPGDLYAWLEK